ncbi:MAG: flagellar motor switch protein FliG [Hungatella sp.]
MANQALTPEQKAAAVVVFLGADQASQIYKYLDETDIEQLTVEVAKLGRLSADDMQDSLDEYYKMCLTQKVMTDGGLEYARAVLEKAFGEATATALLQKMSKSLQSKSFDFLRKIEVKDLVTILQYERSQVIALILAYLESDQSAAVIEFLPREKRIDVVESIAKMESVSPEAIKIVEAEMKKKFSGFLTTGHTVVGGIDYVAEVMNNMNRGNEKLIFDEMGRSDAELADAIRKKMFVFEDISLLDNRAIQRFLRDCEAKDLVYALKGTSDTTLSSLIFANMSSRMADSIRSDLEITTNVRLKDVEEAQQRIVNVIRHLEEEGELIISRGGKDEVIA